VRSFEHLRRMAPGGLFTTDGPPWLRARRQIQPSFHRQRVAGFGAMMVSLTEAMLADWERLAGSGRPLDVSEAMMRLTLRIVVRALFSSDISPEARRIGRAAAIMLADVTFRFDQPFHPLWLPSRHNRAFWGALRTMDEVVGALVAERQARPQPAGEEDLLSMLMCARDEATGAGMSPAELRDHVVTLIIAGHETTALALIWSFYLLSQHPDVEARLRAELAEVLGGRAPTVDDVPRLEYTRMVYQEALRYYPPIWITNRLALGDDVLCGYRIPAGTTLSLSPYATQRMAEHWPDPDRFDPERFTPARVAARPAYAYFPFGGGPRQCIGHGFAMLEGQLILAAVLQRVRLALLPGHTVVPRPIATLRPRDGLPMHVALA
jgi:cytochrome P450